jgi:hypothetical protein
MSVDTIVEALRAADGWMPVEDLLAATGLTRRQLGQRLKGRTDLVDRSDDEPPSYRLVATDGASALMTISAPAPIEVIEDDAAPGEPRADLAIWQDGSMTIARGDATLCLSPTEVAAMAAHMGRFMVAR